MSKWKLINVTDIKWQQDTSGYYTIINWVKGKSCTGCTASCSEIECGEKVRLDILTTSDQPAISFQGCAENVRKAVMQYAEANDWNISLEHAAYIGYELCRAEEQGILYMQD